MGYYNTQRPHQGIGDATPASRFLPAAGDQVAAVARIPVQRRPERPGETWVSRKVTTNGVVCVGWQQVSLGKHRAGSRADVLVTDGLLQFWTAASCSRP